METDLKLGDGRTLHVYDTGVDEADGRLAVFWHHGTPNIGAPPEPLFAAAARLGIRSGKKLHYKATQQAATEYPEGLFESP